MPTLKTPAQTINVAPGQLLTLRRLVQRGSAKLVGRGGESVEIPASVSVLLAEIASNMAAGKAVSAAHALPSYIRDKVAKTTAERMAEKTTAQATTSH